ncbi:unnamed protein product [Haemonchus placei]|uniref:DNA-directed DNA polymerase n=1 Tax=Haemonchus placei TaxID=6290 RepID=A0A0N4XBC7_HAEPC|nr:unnamed protein product [Haemonchus placei]
MAQIGSKEVESIKVDEEKAPENDLMRSFILDSLYELANCSWIVIFFYDSVRDFQVVREIRFRVEQATGLTCSAGIAPNFRLAKICSDMNKPNGQYELANNYEKVMEFLSTLPIRKVCGIGRVSEALLQACGICTVGQLLERRAALKFCFSELSQECFLRVALGLPGRPSSSDPRRKSISTERTFTPTSSREALIEIMEDVCDMLVEDMKRAGVVGGRCVTLKLKLSSFDVLTRSETPGRLVSSREEILAITGETLDRELPNEFRLLGIRLSNLQFEDERASGEPISVSSALFIGNAYVRYSNSLNIRSGLLARKNH